MSATILNSSINRRQFLSMAVVTVTALSLPAISEAASNPRALSFYHTHTGKKLDIVYGSQNRYDPRALSKINHFLRDFRTGEMHPIDPHLLDILSSIRREFGGQRTFEVISGYRSLKTNQQLSKKSSKVAKRSLHMLGQAIDIRMTGVSTRKVQQCALDMKRGGVGFYGKSNFVHLDTGRVRFW
ncbi:YcbK family protein [Desulfocapsa sulfexigens]|nr:YcbK family protein [Desulfocapsa sulfexigens]